MFIRFIAWLIYRSGQLGVMCDRDKFVLDAEL